MSSPASLQTGEGKAENAAWFCLRSQPKHEHIAAAHLRKMGEIDVFLPRVRFKRGTRQGTAWVTEALFPGYLFVRFDWKTSLRRVQYVSGAQGIVHFGDQWPVIPEKAIEELRQAVGTSELNTILPPLSSGDAVRIVDGTLRGLNAVVSHVMPGRERIAVLMDFLGCQTMIELKTSAILKEGDDRVAVFQDKSPS